MRKFTQAEENILNILWKIGKGFPKEIEAQIKNKVPYNTFLSTLRKLEKDGYVGFEKFGRSHRYYPILEKNVYGRSLFKNLFKNYLGGSKEQLLSFFMEEENVDPKEIKEILKKFKSK